MNQKTALLLNSNQEIKLKVTVVTLNKSDQDKGWILGLCVGYKRLEGLGDSSVCKRLIVQA